ncbi:MAG: glycosyltransferase family 4 protein [Bdellovibrionales bacterium]|nr:glycosyltransferase family 4 protein [Bdellovibrionales bacterium]
MQKLDLRLTIVGEVFISPDGNDTVDRSFNAILKAYRSFVTSLHYVGPSPCEALLSAHHSAHLDTFFTTIPEYNKSLRGRISGFLQREKISQRILSLCSQLETNLIQVRLPAVLPLSLAPFLLQSSLPVSFYLSGNWYRSLCATYPYPLVSYLAKQLANYERSLLLQAPVITAGPALARELDLPEAIAYFSTTHETTTEVTRKRTGKRLLYVGRIEPQKRLEDLIDAVAIVQESFPDIHLTIVGEGETKSALQQRAQDRGISHLVTWRGRVDDSEQLDTIYSESDILVLPSLSEGSPKVLPEGMSYGVIPIGVRSAGSVPDIIAHNENGYLVDPCSPQEIAIAISNLLNSPHEQERLSQNAYAYAEKHTLSSEVHRVLSELSSLNHHNVLSKTQN